MDQPSFQKEFRSATQYSLIQKNQQKKEEGDIRKHYPRLVKNSQYCFDFDGDTAEIYYKFFVFHLRMQIK